MEERPLFVAIDLCWNERVYLQNQLPQLLKVCDKVIVVDDFSEDGTEKWIHRNYNPKIEFYQRHFDCCANQFDYALSKAPKDNTWVYCITADELPTTYFFNNVRRVLDNADSKNIDRIFMTVFHLRGEDEMSSEVGGQLRLFRNDKHHQCHYIDYPHERLHGEFDGHCISQPGQEFAFVHFRQADPKKVQDWKTVYIEKGVYSLWDINRRLNIPTISLPPYIKYSVNEELRKHLGWITLP